MSLGNGISGKNGNVVVNGVSIYELTKWSGSFKSNNPAYSSNKTNGHKKRVPGIKDANGAMDGVWDPGNPIYGTNIAGQLREGVATQAYLYIDANQYYNVYLIVDQFKIDVDLDEGAIVGWSIDWAADGAWAIDTVVEESSESSSSSSSSSGSSSSSST